MKKQPLSIVIFITIVKFYLLNFKFCSKATILVLNKIEICQSLLSIAQEFGLQSMSMMPKITSQYQRLTNASQSVPSLRLNYAAKACPICQSFDC